MLKIKTSEWQFGKKIQIENEINSFEILFGGNGDLYFIPIMKRIDLYYSKDPIYFEIKKEDGYLYSRFNHLFDKIVNYEAYERSHISHFKEVAEEIEMQRKQDLYRKYPLVHGGIISWHSDDEYIENSSVLNINKAENGTIKLEFIKNKPENEMYMTYSIRFRNSGSKYDPFNFRFVELYNKLCAYYFAHECDENVSEDKPEFLLKKKL